MAQLFQHLDEYVSAMPRTNRYIESGKPHELCLRVRKGLPFVSLLFIKLLLESAMARALRGRRVILCHYVWMGNHLHIVVVVKDAKSAVQFYGELQKRLTDIMKQLLGVSRLRLWEGRATVAPIIGVDTMIWRLSYFYANPSRANLVDRIEDYPGATSWREFSKADELDSTFTFYVPWIRLPAIPKVGARSVSRNEDRKLTKALLSSTKRKEALIIEPNAWMVYLGVEEKELAGINASIISRVRDYEKQARHEREKNGKKPLGAAHLRNSKIMRDHTPKKKARKIFVLCLDKEHRILFIQKVKALHEYCKNLFAKRLFNLWPPGMFVPSHGMLASAIT